MNDLDLYSIDDLNFAVNQVYHDITSGKHTSSQPKAYLLGGQSGSGKSTLIRLFMRSDPDAISINGDEYRKLHPNFKAIFETYGEEAANHTQSFSNAVTNTLVEKLSSEGYDLIIEGTCRRADVPLKTCRDLKEKGYSVELAVMCVDKYTAWQSTLDGYEEMKRDGALPRAVPRDKYEETIKALPKNIDLLYRSGEFDEITFYNRHEDCLYRMTAGELLPESFDNSPKARLEQIINAHNHVYIGKEYAYSYYVDNGEEVTGHLTLGEALDIFKSQYRDCDDITLNISYNRLDGKDYLPQWPGYHGPFPIAVYTQFSDQIKVMDTSEPFLSYTPGFLDETKIWVNDLNIINQELNDDEGQGESLSPKR